jgi:hypothetical protein
MTRKDFNLIAETIRLLPSFTAYVHLKPVNSTAIVGDAVRFDALCNRFAEALATTNPRFDKDRFVAAMGREAADAIRDQLSTAAFGKIPTRANR